MNKHSGAVIKTSSSIKCTVAMTLVFALEASFSKRSQVMCFLAPLWVQVKRTFWSNFSKVFEWRKILCNNSDQRCFSDTLTSAGPLGRCWNPRLSGSSFNTSLGIQQILMHRKSCWIPIMTPRIHGRTSQWQWSRTSWPVWGSVVLCRLSDRPGHGLFSSLPL